MTVLKSLINKKNEILPGTVILIIIVLYNLYVICSGKDWLIYLTKEDGLIEYAAVIFYLSSAGIMISLYFMSQIAGRKYFLGFERNIIFLLTGILFVIFAGEEVSWGQRIFNFDTPEFWSRINRQGEVTLHNLNFWEALDKSGNQKDGLIRLFSSVALYTYLWFNLLIIIPILNRTWLKANRFFKKAGIPVVHMLYGILFLLNYLVFELLERTPVELRPIGELKETNYALLYFAACVSVKSQFNRLTISARDKLIA